MKTEKINLLFLHPGPIYLPELPDIKDKYVMLSADFKGLLLSWTAGNEYQNYKMGDFTFHGMIRKHSAYFDRFFLGVYMVTKAIEYHYKTDKFNVIICYDPLFTGIVGTILKHFLRCKLVVEVNSNMLTACFLGRSSMLTRIKKNLYKKLIELTLGNADTIKFLYPGQEKNLGYLIKNKRTVCFHDFVPTHYFMQEDTSWEKYILFVGWPFYLKGVDTLIRAFQKISNKYSDFRLKLVGHKLKDDVKKYFEDLNGKVELCFPMHYDKLKKEFLRCYCFVLPSRSEGMPRVLLEAMASGKPLIGSIVGGIPELIQNSKNGFLFHAEDVNELASRLDILLGNFPLAQQMGMNSKRLIQEKFSSEIYCKLFKKMINQMQVGVGNG